MQAELLRRSSAVSAKYIYYYENDSNVTDMLALQDITLRPDPEKIPRHKRYSRANLLY